MPRYVLLWISVHFHRCSLVSCLGQPLCWVLGWVVDAAGTWSSLFNGEGLRDFGGRVFELE